MVRYGAQFGPDITFLGADAPADRVRRCAQLPDAVRRVGYEVPVVGMDVVEVSPP